MCVCGGERLTVREKKKKRQTDTDPDMNKQKQGDRVIIRKAFGRASQCL